MPFDPNDPDVKVAIANAVEEATSSLKRKNDDLFVEVKKLKKGREIDPDEVSKLERERDELLERVLKAEKELSVSKKAAETISKNYESELAFTSRLLVDNGLREALLEVGVKNPVHAKAVMAMMRNEVKVASEGENRIARVGDKDLKTHIKEWSLSDEGKQFISAPENFGGGANGGSKPTGSKVITRSEFNSLSQPERRDFSIQGGKVTDG